MKLYLNTLIIAFAVIFQVACYDDKGNYDYTDISQVKVTDVEEVYSKVSYRDTLHIVPKINSTNPQDEFECLWVINPAYIQTPSMGEQILKDTIGFDKELHYPVNLRLGTYDLVLKVTNIATGHAEFIKMSLEVTTPFALGFYALKEKNGCTEIDLHKPDGEVVENVLTMKYGEAMTGEPKSMGLVFSYCYIDPETSKYTFTSALTICAGKDAKILNLQDMSTIFTHENMFWGEANQEEIPRYICPGYYGINYLSNQGVSFSYQYLTIPGSGKFGYPLLLSGSEQSNCIPNINCVFSQCLYFFDELNHRFLVCDFNGALHSYEKAPVIPYNLIFFGRNKVGADNNGYALFEDDKTGKRYLYKLVLDTKFSNNPILETFDVPESSALATATLFGINEQNARIMYFVKDNQLYSFDLGLHTEKVLVPEGFVAGEEITYISNRYWENTTDKENNFNYLVIGTHSNGRYKLYMYNTLGGLPTGAPVKVLQGNGKVVKVQFSSNKMSDNTVDSPVYPATF